MKDYKERNHFILRTTFWKKPSQNAFEKCTTKTVMAKSISIAIDILLPNISQNKGNQTMKLGQLIVCNQMNFLLQESCRKRGREISSRSSFVVLRKCGKCDGKTISKSFSKKSELSISLDQ